MKYTEERMNQKSLSKRAAILQLLVEGNSLRATSRITDVSINTVYKLLTDIGPACTVYQDRNLRNLPCRRIQVDEIWSYVYAKNKNVRWGMEDYAGDLWTFTAICQDTKLIPSWYIGSRSAPAAKEFIKDLSSRMSGRIQLTSDGFPQYKDAVEEAFGSDIDYAMMIKEYDLNTGRYLRTQRKQVNGSTEKITTAHVERQNLSMRTNIRRFTRKTNALTLS